ncbi:MAG: ribonuclease PH [Alphaproteobacteria bacterium]|nr:ribonuclease PH [Alphaproteobacteria bacterium]
MTLTPSKLRHDQRLAHDLREVKVTTGVNPHAEGSCLIRFGKTEVLCTASVQDKVPAWLRGKGQGWLTAEYGMLPRATHERKDREATKGKQEGRTIEIQRLIGRSLRAVTDLKALDGFTLWLDCDVLVADGGTRTAAITGSYLAASVAVHHLQSRRLLKSAAPVLRDQVAAISCGLTSDGVVLDMDYQEDSTTLADGNFVMAGSGHWVEVQLSAEQRPVTAQELTTMQQLAQKGLYELFDLQRQVLTAALET